MTLRYNAPFPYDEDEEEEEDEFLDDDDGYPYAPSLDDDDDIPIVGTPPPITPPDPTRPPTAPGGVIQPSGGIGRVRDRGAVNHYGNSYEGMTVTERNSFKRFYTDYARAAASLFKKAPEDLTRSQLDHLDGLVESGTIDAPEIRPEDDPEVARSRRRGASESRAARGLALREEAAARARESYEYGVGLRPIREERAESAAARAAENYAYSTGRREITEERSAAAALRSARAEERAMAASLRAARGEERASGRFQSEEISRTTPRPLPAEPRAAQSRLPNLTWNHVLALIPPEDLTNLTSAWSSGSDGEGAISHDRWRYIQALIPLSPAIPVLARYLRSLFISSGGGRGASRRATVFRPQSVAAPPRQPLFRRPRG